MTCAQENIVIRKGRTFRMPVRYAVKPYIYKAISAVEGTVPVTLTIIAHGVPNGWRVSLVGSEDDEVIPPRVIEWREATYVDNDTIELNEVLDTEDATHIVYETPASLADLTVRMQIRASTASDTVLITPTIALDDALKTITITISAEDTAAIDWRRGVYDLEVEDADGNVVQLLEGRVEVKPEVTR